MTQLQEQQQPQAAAPIKVKTRRRANSVAFACRTDYGLPDDDDDNGVLAKPLFLVAEPAEQRRRSATEVIEGAKERAGGIFTLS